MEFFEEKKGKGISGGNQNQENINDQKCVEKENITINPSSPVPQININKSKLSSPNRRKSGSPLSIIRNFASLSNRGSPTSRASPKTGSSSPFSKLFLRVSRNEKLLSQFTKF